MTSLVTHHPEDGLLLRYIDGELPGRKIRQVQRHLEACWQCRTEIEELETTVANCVRYRKNVLQTYLPDPPNPWPDLYRDFARIDSSASGGFAAARQLATRLMNFLGSVMVRRWAVGAVAALVMVSAVWRQFRETPSVQAAALLKRAVLATGTLPAPARRVQFRTKTQKFTRTIGVRKAAGSRLAPAAEPSLAPVQAPIEQMFRAAHYDWDDPLSAGSYQAWRDSVPSKQDQVTASPDSYQIRTIASGGNLAVASLVLRSSDLRPVEGRLEFRDREWVELTDITDAPTRDDGAPVATIVEPPARPAEPSRPAATLSGPASISDELQVFAALHELGADLGDPVEVKLSGGRVVVGGMGISPQRQQEIRARLDTMLNVAVRFSDPASAAASGDPGSAAPADTVAQAAPAGLQARVEQHLGGHAEFQSFSSQVLDRNESLMSRVYALRRLAENFPADAALAGKDRDILRDLARQHAAALDKDVSGMERALNPLLAAMGGTAASRPATGGTPAQPAWQSATEELFHASHRVEVLVSVLLGVTPANTATERLPSDLRSALGELRADLDACQRLLAPQLP